MYVYEYEQCYSHNNAWKHWPVLKVYMHMHIASIEPTILFLYFISTGCIGSLGRNAPCLKLIIADLFVVVPA